MKQLTGIEITTSLSPTATLPILKLEKFEKLSVMTHESIRNEIEASFNELEYTQVVAPWLPVKCYYRLYYLESVLLYLLNGSVIGFSHGGHAGVRKGIKSLVSNGQLTFSNPAVSDSPTIGDARVHRIASGSNLSPNFYMTTDCVGSVRKKIADYVEHDFKEKERIISYQSADNRRKRDQFYANNNLNLTDFFYWMRIKANYKDVDYLDFTDDISPNDAYMYIMRYAAAQESYAFALQALITQLKISRRM